MNQSPSNNHPYLYGILSALLCTLLTAISSAIPQVIGLTEGSLYLVMAIGIGISSIIGVVIMKKSRVPFNIYGFRRIQSGSISTVLWYLPLLLIALIPLLTSGFNSTFTASKYMIVLFFTIATGFNEEVYFRGLTYQCLKQKSGKIAIWGSSFLFGSLHIANAFSGRPISQVILQIIFSFLVGVVLAELLCITKSLWIGIAWHALNNYINSIANEASHSMTILVSITQVTILLIYAIFLWKKSKLE